LLELVRDNSHTSAGDVLGGLAAELGMTEEAMLAFGPAQLEQLIEQSVVLVTNP
jgi:hypothetical protein